MNERLKALLIALLLGAGAIGATACEQEGPFEEAGEEVDEAADEAEDAFE